MALTGDYRINLALHSPNTSLSFSAPLLVTNVNESESRRVADLRTDRERVAAGYRPARPPWAFAFLSNVPGSGALESLDPDPVITAHGVAEVMLAEAGEVPGPPGHRYVEAIAELRSAIAALSASNE